MHCHANARLTPRGRAEVFAAVEAGMTVVAACLAFRVSRRTYYRWLPRWQARGFDGLVDRSSRPLRSPQRLSATAERQIAGLRLATGWGPDRIAATLGLPASTVHRAIRRLGLGRPAAALVPVARYEFAEPGGLLHLDTKKLGRIGAGPGHRATGDRTRRNRGIGWEVLHVAIDDATRLVYAELLPDERGRTSARFLVRALRWFTAQGVTVVRLLTDNGSAYRSRVVRTDPALARPAPQPDSPVSPPDQRQGRALDPHRPVRVPLRRGLPLRRRSQTCAGALHRLLQRTAPASRHRRADPTSAAHRPDGGMIVTNLAGDYT